MTLFLESAEAGTTTRPPIALTPGDAEGVGPEVGVVAAAGRSDVVLLGDSAVWQRAADLRGIPFEELWLEDADPASDPEWSHLPSVAAIATGVKGCLSGRFRALCTGPIHKESLLSQGFPHRGHTEYLAALCGLPVEEAVMLFAGGQLTVGLATVHVPLAEVPTLLDAERIVRTGSALATFLEPRMEGQPPRIAVCGLNPHAGEGGQLGREDQDVVAPAIDTLRKRGVDATGPWPADTVFARALAGDYDAVVALYHDQGLIPVKTIDFGRSVNITAGLPIVRTSVDHGTARDISWSGTADAGPMAAALKMAGLLS